MVVGQTISVLTSVCERSSNDWERDCRRLNQSNHDKESRSRLGGICRGDGEEAMVSNSNIPIQDRESQDDDRKARFVV